MIVIFEGPDAGGKDFVRAAFEQATKYENTVVSRFMISQMVYARYFNRPQWKNPAKRKSMENTFRAFMKNFKPLIVYCHADKAVLESRIRRRGEDLDQQPASETVKDIFDWVFEDFKLEKNVIRIDTTEEPPMEDVVNRICNRIKKLEKR